MEELKIQHKAIVLQDVYEYEYKLEQKKEVFRTANVKFTGIVEEPKESPSFYKTHYWSIFKTVSEKFKTEKIINAIIPTVPFSKGEKIYNPITEKSYKVEDVARGLNGIYYYKVENRYDEPENSVEIFEKLLKEQEEKIKEYLESNKYDETVKVHQALEEVTKTKKRWWNNR